MSLENQKNSVTIGVKDDSKSWNIIQANFIEKFRAKEIGYIGMPSRKTYIFKDRELMNQFVAKLTAKKIKHSIDCMYPKPDLW